jgi:hypothetical protein
MPRATGQPPRRASRALLLSLALLAACGNSHLAGGGQQGVAAARFTISTAALAAVSQVVGTISKGDGPDFPAFEIALTDTGTSWSAFTTGVPPGAGRQFDVLALDATGAPLLASSAKADVAPSGIAYVAMVLQPATPPAAYAAAAPVIDLLTASSTLVIPGGAVHLDAVAHDPVAGAAVTYRWSASCQGDPACLSATGCGTFDSTSAAAVSWTAPGAADTCQLSLTVQGNQLLSVSATLGIDVSTSAAPSLVAM